MCACVHVTQGEKDLELFYVEYFVFVFFCQLVAGSAVMAYELVCPDRVDLIHKNFRKLCNLMADVDEWGQVAVINMLTRYARTQFLNPNLNVSTCCNFVHIKHVVVRILFMYAYCYVCIFAFCSVVNRQCVCVCTCIYLYIPYMHVYGVCMCMYYLCVCSMYVCQCVYVYVFTCLGMCVGMSDCACGMHVVQNAVNSALHVL